MPITVPRHPHLIGSPAGPPDRHRPTRTLVAVGAVFVSLSAAVLAGTAAAGHAGPAGHGMAANAVTPTWSDPSTGTSPGASATVEPTRSIEPTPSTDPTPASPSPSGTPTPAPTRSTPPSSAPSGAVPSADGHGGGADGPRQITPITPSDAAWRGAGAGFGGPAPTRSAPAATARPDMPAAAPVETVPVRSTAADRRPEDHRRTLVYSGIFGLAIATTGLAMVGWRRQHW
ncbi:hypothetical protein [Polymorphospora lycopeni]|uniref:Uncharacterized protein n=1 Tax=Polymorphospora lycopeni TaxID=3140240 RepID=A0ABV5CHP1_9ACTN